LLQKVSNVLLTHSEFSLAQSLGKEQKINTILLLFRKKSLSIDLYNMSRELISLTSPPAAAWFTAFEVLIFLLGGKRNLKV
jgi:hypothetical protein